MLIVQYTFIACKCKIQHRNSDTLKFDKTTMWITAGDGHNNRFNQLKVRSVIIAITHENFLLRCISMWIRRGRCIRLSWAWWSLMSSSIHSIMAQERIIHCVCLVANEFLFWKSCFRESAALWNNEAPGRVFECACWWCQFQVLSPPIGHVCVSAWHIYAIQKWNTHNQTHFRLYIFKQSHPNPLIKR